MLRGSILKATNLLERKLQNHGILLEDALKNSTLRELGSKAAKDIYTDVYGAKDTQIVPVVTTMSEDSEATRFKRQLMIERSTQLRSLTNYYDSIEVSSRFSVLPTPSKTANSFFFQWTRNFSRSLKAYSLRETTPAVLKELLFFISPDVISIVTSRTVVSSLCSPKELRRTVSRTNKSDDLDPTVEKDYCPSELFTTLCESLGKSLNFEINSMLKKPPFVWEASTKIQLAGELLRLFFKEAVCEVPYYLVRKEFTVEPKGYANSDRQDFAGSSGLHFISSTSLVDLADIQIAEYGSWPKVSRTLKKKYIVKEPNEVVRVHAFLHTLSKKENYRTVGQVCLRPSLVSLFSKGLPSFLDSHAKVLPLVIPAKSWRGFWEGGYMTHRVPFIRSIGTKLPFFDTLSADVSVSSRVLDYLGSVPWKINTRILRIVTEIWQAGIDCPGVPERSYRMTEPMHTKADLKASSEIASLKATFLLKLFVAENFKHADKIYFPHNLDFRGRVYPVPPHFNHQGDDVCRGLLLFQEGKPLGRRGLFWLKVHLANLFGNDKIGLEARCDWVDENMPKFLEIASSPLDSENFLFWKKADDPFQALACIYEVIAAISSDDPEMFVSHLPVHQDGSCNGLQHYAALGLDIEGARAVNILPSIEVQDIYSRVLQKVRHKIEQKAVCGEQISCEILKLDILHRKVVKQTVMTLSYGVTRLGAKAQVENALKDFLPRDFDRSRKTQIAKHISGLIFSSLEELFEKAMKIKRFFDDCSSALGQEGMSVNWMSPVNFFCRQPYRSSEHIRIGTFHQEVTLSKTSDADPVNSRKQKLGFPPNFIHSLDAAHMMITARRSQDSGIAFASVHDSYWSHASDIDKLNSLLREGFIELYSNPILANLHRDFSICLGSQRGNLPELPSQGELDLKNVRESEFFFD
jgi:DNA-directed RNA polymerase, mitochondrial